MALEHVREISVALRVQTGVSEITGRSQTRTITLRNIADGLPTAALWQVVVALVPVVGYPLMTTERRVISRVEA